MERLVLFHLSDLHFGLDLNLYRLPRRQGLSGHDHEVAIELDVKLRDLVASEYPDDVKLMVVSGDLTVMGTRTEMHLAHSYLHGELRTDALGGLMGLGDLRDAHLEDLLVIPGNHDHWAGDLRNMYSRTPPNEDLYNDVFLSDGDEDEPWYWARSYDFGGGQLQIMGIESNWDGRQHTKWACGDVDPAVYPRLATWIAQQNQAAGARRAARVLTLHHSPARGEWDHRLHDDALRELGAFCTGQQVHAVLTGHIHDVMLGSVHAQSADSLTNPFTEIRCGTSLQRRIQPKAQEHTFLVHEISSVPGPRVQGLLWKTRHFFHNDVTMQFEEWPHSPPYTLSI